MRAARWARWVLGLGALAGTGALLARGRARRPRPLVAVPASSTGARSAELARLGARLGSTVVSNRARRVFASAERREQLDRDLELRTAEEVAATLGGMKGVMMKLGQVASFVDDGMPEPMRDALAQLQADAPPMSPDLANQVVESELGDAPTRVFAEWDPVPIAAASIGQVHRAITHDGRAVAVKVQYPGVENAIRADLASLDVSMLPAPLLFENFDAGPFIEEIRARVGEELDYRVEARNQQLFADWYRGHPFIHVPDVVPALSAEKVLTTELATGARFSELEQWPDDERQLASETIFRFVFRSLWELRAFNGDPHPGNYLFHAGGRVTFLDFGLVKRFTDDDIDQLMDLTRTMIIDRDVEAFRRAAERADYYPTGAPVSGQDIWDASITFWAMIQEDAPFRFTSEYASNVVRQFFFGRMSGGPAVKYANMPARWVVLQRIQVGLVAILGRLDAENNWRRISEEMWPGFDRSPSTDLGRQEAGWLAQKAALAR